MSAKYTVNLTTEEEDKLLDLTKKGKNSARTFKKGQSLLLANQGYTDSAIAKGLSFAYRGYVDGRRINSSSHTSEIRRRRSITSTI
jgi:hypothetical protein